MGQRGHPGSLGQGHKLVNVDVIWKCLTRRKGLPNMDTVHCTDEKIKGKRSVRTYRQKTD